jgi:hypothetical protein
MDIKKTIQEKLQMLSEVTTTYHGSKNDMKKILKEELKIVLADTTISINVGDEILGGKFKNKKIKVKEIGTNDKGEITINGTTLLRFRIPEKM